MIGSFRERFALVDGWMATAAKLATLGTLSAVIGAIIDSTGAYYYSSLTACASQSNDPAFYGRSAEFATLAKCLTYNSKVQNMCQCATAGASSCLSFMLQNEHSTCGQILNPYATNIKSSAILCAVNAFMASCLSLSIYTTSIQDKQGTQRRNDSACLEASKSCDN